MKSFKIINAVSCIFSVMVIWILPVILTNAQTSSQAPPITRTQVWKRAMNMINLQWNYSAAKNGVTNSPDVMQPQQLQNATSGQMTGIPYCWGGLDSLDMKSDDAPWANFLDAINQGAYAGNVNTSDSIGYIPGTAGIDCSGFIQAAYNIQNPAKLSTWTMFNTYFTPISVNELKRMDILNKSDWHVTMFDRWGTLNGVDGAFTCEATPEFDYGGIEGTKRYFISLAELNSGYVPGRYINIVEEPGVPSPQLYSNLSTGNYAVVQNVTDWAYFRSGGSTFYPAVGWIPKGTVLFLEDFSNWWFKVTYKGVTGWIWSGVLAPIPTGTYVGLTSNTTGVNVRTDTSLSGSVIGLISPGEYPEVLEYSDDYQWMKISYDGLVGWSSVNYLQYVF